VFPRALLQWEDFGKGNAFTLLKNYQNRILSFNDDIQGTGSIATAALATALKIKKGPLAKERIAIYGFGQAGSGIANSIVTLLQKQEGISLEEARRRIYAVDINGLMIEGDKAEEYQKNFLQPKSSIADWPIDKTKPPQLEDVVKHAKITILIGVSAQPGIFTDKILRHLAANTDRPIVFALSNPTSKCETTPQAVMSATEGKALMATGSPFAPVAGPNGRKSIYRNAIICMYSRRRPGRDCLSSYQGYLRYVLTLPARRFRVGNRRPEGRRIFVASIGGYSQRIV
jgi:malate dehydrogenase (oxaloacetate-decarboxylating)